MHSDDVVAPNLGPPDCRVADFIDIQSAIDALPPGGGKIFVKAGDYIISKHHSDYGGNVLRSKAKGWASPTSLRLSQ